MKGIPTNMPKAKRAKPGKGMLKNKIKKRTARKTRVASAGESSAFRQQGVPKRRAEAELKYIPWNTVEMEELNPLLRRQFVVGRDIMVARVLMKKGCIVPEHSHVNEQVTYILEGALKFWIDGREIVVHAGEVLTIPPNMPHRAEALEETVDLDVFNPPRADWMNKDDRYLRGTK
jgi:quercetin dioxygenase-like cupin family protein